MIEFLYTFLKDFWRLLKSKNNFMHEDKTVDMEWIKKSGLEKYAEHNGYKLAWSNPEKIESRKLEGYHEWIQIDKKAKKKYCFTNKSGQILIYKSKTS